MHIGKQWDAIVVGSGLGGLSTAAYLAAAGRKTLLLERYTTLGGTSHVFSRRGQWEFDCGVHYVSHCGPDGIVTAMMSGIGIDDRITWLPMDQSGFDRIIAPGFELATPVGWDAYEANLIDAFPGERKSVRRFHGLMRRIGEAHDRNDMVTAGGMARWAARAGRGAAFMGVPYAATLAALGISSRMAYALSVQSGAVACSPTVLPTAAMAAFFQDYIGAGSYYPKGGGQILAAGFAAVITAHGGAIRTNSDVAEILLDDGRVQGVRLSDGEVLSSATVVSNADIIKTYTDLIGLEKLPRLFRRRVSGWKMSQPLINGFFGVEIDLADQPNSNYFSIPDWGPAKSYKHMTAFGHNTLNGEGFDVGAEWARDMAHRQPMFVQSSSRRDPSNRRAAPHGHATIEVQTVTPSDPRLWGFNGYDIASGDYSQDSGYLEVKKIIIDGMLERMEQAFPGSSSKVKLSELGTPATQTRFVNNTAGAPFGLQLRLSQTGPMRPRDTTPIPGLYTVGTSTAWGPGTVGSMLSGVNAAGSIIGRDLVPFIRTGGRLADSSALPRWEDDFNPFTTTRALHD
ncbi:phytoene desaturase family protein [[Mycobacterium] manitobense]|uniref:phytoene desaturase family protein n=1 Tax=[Mycobacterium] manitobense TaxID=190147 RepID=UPI0021F31AAA|nr:NAD(P)/FAD-dependent oxidoreductase [[Mycobacterium] manitobense]